MPGYFTFTSRRSTHTAPKCPPSRTLMQPASPTMVPLPSAPINGSPVPHLTSIHSVTGRGPYGDSRYRGNCGGHLIRDLIQYFGAKRVLDPMTGSGTCRDVCTELGTECVSFDLKLGQNATDPASYRDLGQFDFIWLHPPYWRMIRYNDDLRCLSAAPTLDAFLDSMKALLACGRDVLTPNGVIAVLIGGFSDYDGHQRRHIPLAALTNQVALDTGLWPACTEIIRFQHGNTSSRRAYTSSFIPGLHDTCMVFRKGQ